MGVIVGIFEFCNLFVNMIYFFGKWFFEGVVEVGEFCVYWFFDGFYMFVFSFLFMFNFGNFFVDFMVGFDILLLQVVYVIDQVGFGMVLIMICFVFVVWVCFNIILFIIIRIQIGCDCGQFLKENEWG